MKRKVYILNHTHWDREWYKTKDELAVKLKYAIKNIFKGFDNNQFKSYFLDGQTAIIDDLKEIMDEKDFERFIKMIQNKELILGPLHILPDEYIPSMEVFLENIEKAKEVAKKYKFELPNAIYLPDMFGNIPQLPQIANQNGFDWIIAHRGINQEHVYNVWEHGEHKANLMALPLMTGYYNPFINNDDFIKQINEFINKTKDNFKDKPIVLFSGSDHLFISNDFKDRIDEYNNSDFDYELVEVSYFELINILKDISPENTIQGEQKDNSKMLCLIDVGSARLDAKLASASAENYVFNKWNVFNAWHNTENDLVYKNATKLLVKNSAHDSVVGSSTDDVNDKVVSRYISAKNMIKSKLELEYFNNYDINHLEFKKHLTVYSTIPTKQKQLVRTWVNFPKTKESKVKNFSLSHDDRDIKFNIIKEREYEHLVSDLNHVDYYPRNKYLIEFVDIFNGYERKTYVLRPNINNKTDIGTATNSIKIKNNSFAIKGESIKLENIQVVIEKDLGDSYNFAHEEKRDIQRMKLELVSSNQTPVGEVVVIKATNSLFDVNVKLTVSYYNDLDAFKVVASMQNFDKTPFRINMLYKEAKDGQSWLSDIPFSEQEYFETPFNKDFKYEAPLTYRFSKSYVKFDGVKVDHNGAHMFGIDVDGKNKSFTHTLYRTSNVISKQKISTRNIGAGPEIFTPGGANIGKTLEVGLFISSDIDYLSRNLFSQSLYFQHNKDLEDESLFVNTNNNIYISTINKVNGSILVRGFNKSAKEETLFIGNKEYKLEGYEFFNKKLN